MGRRVAFVTGAGSGLGLAIATAFAQAGWDLVLAGRNKGRLRDAARQLQDEHGAQALSLQLELGSCGGEQAAQEAVDAAVERFGRIDALVNASQAAKVGDTLERCKPADLELALSSGLVAAFLLMRACYPQLREHSGTVVNLTSAGAAAGQPGLGMLAASKEGLRGMSRVAAAEWGGCGVRVHCLDPQVRSGAYSAWAREYPQAAEQAALQLEDPLDFGRRCVALCERP